MSRLGGGRAGRLGYRFLFPPSREPAFLVAVVRAGFQFVVLTGVAVEEQDRLGVFGSHAASLRRWRVVVKRSTMCSVTGENIDG